MVAAARAALLAAALASALALPPRRPGADQDGVAERLERLERGLLPVPAPPASRDAPAQTLPARAARVQELVRSGHGQVGRWFRDLVPLVECAGEPACTAGALAQVTRKSDLWTLPGMEVLVELVRGNATWFAGRVACAAPTVAAFQEALEALPGPAPRIALVPGGRAPLRAAGRPWITISPRAAEALGRVGELLTAPMAALEAKGNLTLALEVDVDDAWFLAGRPSADVSAVHLVGEGRIIVNPRHAAKLRAIAAAGAAGNTMLSDSYDAISRALAAPAASSGHITDPRQLQQSADAALLDILLSVVSATVGDQGLELPWKCFVCVVTLSMLLPLATNLALQGLVSIYCAVAKLPPDDCIYIRYDMIAFALLITPLEVYPIAEVCVLQHGCH